MRVEFVPAIPAPDSATVRKVPVNLPSVRKQLTQTMMPVFCGEAVLQTVADILRQTRLRTSKGYLEGFIVQRSYCVVLVATSVGVAWNMS